MVLQVVGCVYPPPTPKFDLVIESLNLHTFDCNDGQPDCELSIDIKNIGDIKFDDELFLSFYNRSPFSSGELLGIYNSFLTINDGETISIVLSEDWITDTNNLYGIVNVDANQDGFPEPLLYDYPIYFKVSTERLVPNNHKEATNTYASGCAPSAFLNTNIINYGYNCDNQVIYEIEICNSGNAPAQLSNIYDYSNENFNLIDSYPTITVTDIENTIHALDRDIVQGMSLSDDGGTVKVEGVTDWEQVNYQLSLFELQPTIHFYEFEYKSIHQETEEEIEDKMIGAFTVMD